MHAFDVLSDPMRRRILELMAEHADSTGEPLAAGAITARLQQETGISQSAVSQHLKVLRDNGFATVLAQGTRRLYAVDGSGFQEATHWLERYRAFWGQRLDALDTELRRGRSSRPQGKS